MALEFGQRAPSDNFTILVWGADGVGKTPTVLHLAQHVGPCAAVDADGGLGVYLKGDEDWIKIVASDDPVYIRKQLTELAAKPGEFKLAAIDPLSTIYENLLKLVGQRERAKSKATISEFDSPLNIGSWNPIKDHSRDLMRLIRWMGMPVICTSREDNLWKKTEIVGARPAGDKNMGYEFTLNVQMLQPKAGGPRFAVPIRDRLRRFTKRIEGAHDDPLFLARKILELYPEKFGGQAVAKECCSSAVALDIHGLIRELRLPHEKIIARIRELGADHIEDLTPSAAGEVLDGLRGLFRERQEAAQATRTSN